jgi:hypothetical protein
MGSKKNQDIAADRYCKKACSFAALSFQLLLKTGRVMIGEADVYRLGVSLALWRPSMKGILYGTS